MGKCNCATPFFFSPALFYIVIHFRHLGHLIALEGFSILVFSQGRYPNSGMLANRETIFFFSSRNYRTSYRYWANFLTSYLQLEPIFLGPDSISMTHETWQIDQHHSFISILKIEIIFLSFKIFCPFFLKSVLGNLDPYSGTWT